MTKLKFRDINGSNEYTVPYNPSEWHVLDSTDYELFNVLDGTPVRCISTKDDRVRRFIWPTQLANNTIFACMVSTLKSYKGQIKEMHPGDMDYLSHGWKTIKIIDVSTELQPGGQLKHNLIVDYVYVDEI